MPWRRSGVKYTNNEAYFDVIEEVDAIIDKNGGTVSAEIHGYVSKKKNVKKVPILIFLSYYEDRLRGKTLWYAGSDHVLHEPSDVR